MARRLQQGDRNKKLHHWLFHPHFAVILGIVCLFEPLMANRVLAQQSAATEQKNSDRNAKVSELLNQAGELNRQGTKESRLKAIARYEEALIIVREIKERYGEAAILYFIGVNYSALNENNKGIDSNKSVEYLKQALPIAQELKKSELEASILSSLGSSYWTLGERQLSINYLKQAVLKYRATNNPKFEALTLGSIGTQYLELGIEETQNAIDAFRQALDIQIKQKDIAGQGQTLASIGLVYTQSGDSQKALNSYKQALELQKQSGDRNGQAGTLSSIANIYSTLGENQLSLNLSSQALEIQRGLQGKLTGRDLTLLLSGQINTLTGLAGTYDLLGNRPKALATYNRPLAKVGDKIREK